MGKWKVCVYAICKNEAKFVRRWMDSMREADWVVVLDTGSDDGTPEMLRKLGAQVTEEVISPWRFDVARNRSLELVPEEADICVCTDLDEVLRPGWRAALGSGVDGEHSARPLPLYVELQSRRQRGRGLLDGQDPRTTRLPLGTPGA